MVNFKLILADIKIEEQRKQDIYGPVIFLAARVRSRTSCEKLQQDITDNSIN